MRACSINKITIAFLSVLSIGLSSCLKDKEYDDRSIQSVRSEGTQKIIEIGVSATNTTNFLSTAFDALNKDTVIDFIPVRLASAEPAPEDIHVTLVKNDALVNDYNTNNGTAYEIPDATMFSVVNPGLVVTIPKGSYVGYLQIKLKPSDFLGSDWALGYKIASVDKQGYTISGNLNYGIVAFGIKNQYDGHYRVTALEPMTDEANPNLTGRYPMDVYLITQSGNSVAMFDIAVGTYAHSISNGGSLSLYGSFSPQFNFDPSGDGTIVSVENAYGQPSSNGRSAELDPSAPHKWDPATHNIDVKYWMNQPSVIPGHRTTFHEHFEYLGPR